jgi:anti-anti-sigma regulatory factor
MACNFHILLTKSGDHICLKLNGDFDGSSACELVNLLNGADLHDSSEILVNTDSLKHVYPFGLNILHHRLHEAKSRKVPLIYTGKMSRRFVSS